MTPDDYLGVLAAVDGLLESVVTDPEAWNEAALMDWAAETAALGSVHTDRTVAREIRRILRVAVRMRDFWAERGLRGAPADWRSRVDVAVGARGWRPGLEIARRGLATAPSPQLFAEVQDRFRVVANQPWMDGISYEEWAAGNS